MIDMASIQELVAGHRFRVDTKEMPSDHWRLGITGRGVCQTEGWARACARCAQGCGLVVRMIEVKKFPYGTVEVEINSTCPGADPTQPLDYSSL